MAFARRELAQGNRDSVALGPTESRFSATGTNLHAVIGLISAMIFVGPPDTRANALTSGDDKMLSQVVSSLRYLARRRRIPA